MSAQALRILVIEDNPFDLLLLKRFLADNAAGDFQLVNVSSLAEGLYYLAMAPFDVVVLDLNLPDSDGLESLKKVVVYNPCVPVVVLTGCLEETLGLEAVRQGAQDYLIKGQTDGPSLVRSLRYAVQRNQLMEEVRRREKHLQLLTNKLPACLWTTDDQMRVTTVFGSGLLGLKTKPSAILNRKLRDLFPSRETGWPLFQAHARALEGESVIFDYETPGQLFHVHIEPVLAINKRIVGTIGVALDVTSHKRIEAGFRTAQQIQRGLLPKSAPQRGHFDIGGVSYPAEATGGDFFDYLPMKDGSLGVIVADASGHGFGPAILAAITHTCLRVLAQTTEDLPAILDVTNRLLHDDTGGERFVTLLFAQFNSLRSSMAFSSAGHPEGYLLDHFGAVKDRIQSNGVPLGILPSQNFPASSPIPLEPGDLVVFYTDGILDAVSPEGVPFGKDRLLEKLQEVRQQPAQEVAESVCRAARDFYQHQPLRDDITTVVIKVAPSSASRLEGKAVTSN
jgi:CheY-like chemotaxis protein